MERIEEKRPVRVVVIGGGVGGTVVANRVARRLGGRAAVELVTASPWHVYEPGLLFVPFHDLPQVEVLKAERDLLRPEVALVPEDPAVAIDVEQKTVRLASGLALGYDYLVLATGSELDEDRIPGLKAAAHHFSNLAAAEKLRDALYRFTGGRIVVGAAALPYKHPQAPAELALLLADFVERNGLAGRTEIVYAYPLDDVFPEPSVAAALRARLEERGIAIRTGFQPVAADDARKLVFGRGGQELPYELLVMVPPHRGSKLAREAGLGDAHGWLPTDPTSLRLVGARDVWVIGDGSNLSVGLAPSAADHQAPVIAEAIVADFEAREPRRRFASYDGRVQLFVELGQSQVALLEGDYDHPLSGLEPSRALEAGKRAFDRAYWQLVPTGVL